MSEQETMLREIPIEYQNTVNAFVDQQIADSDCTTDNDILDCLKRLRDDFDKGYYITPGGEMAFLDIAHPDQIYANGGVDALTSDTDAESVAAERRQNLLKAAGLIAVVVAFIIFLLLGRNGRVRQVNLEESGETAVSPTSESIADTPTVSPLQDVENQGETLQTIGSLGGQLTLGRPASLEVHYQETDEVIAFPIDPALIPPKGDLPFDNERMASENPVAVWVHGTVLNYNIGIPDLYARNIKPQDEIILNTDTGNSLKFVAYATYDGNNYDPARQLSQDRIGATLFSLPAPADNQVRFVSANYDMTTEDTAVFAPLSLDDDIVFSDGNQIEITAVSYEHTLSGEVQFTLQGHSDANTLFLIALSSGHSQTESITPIYTGSSWTAAFSVPDSFTGGEISTEIRAIPSNELLFVDLGHFKRLDEQLQVFTKTAYWDSETQTAVIHLSVTNDGEQRVRLGPTYFKLTGGDQSQRHDIPVISNLPKVLDGRENIHVTLSFSHRTFGDQLVLQAGANLYELQLVEN